MKAFIKDFKGFNYFFSKSGQFILFILIYWEN